MDDQQDLIEQMQKIVALGPFIMMRYVTLAGDTTLEMESKIAFAQALNKAEYSDAFGDLAQIADHDMADRVLGGEPELVLELIEQLKTIISLVYDERDKAFAFKKLLFDFATDIRLSIDGVEGIDELADTHQAVISTLAGLLNLAENMETLEKGSEHSV